MPTKTCNRCGETKPLTEFYRQYKAAAYRSAKVALSCDPSLYYSCCKSCAIQKTLAYHQRQRLVKAERAANKPLYSCSRCGEIRAERFRAVNRSVCASCLYNRSHFSSVYSGPKPCVIVPSTSVLSGA